ncbi:hypothetical protein YC2023_006470 [Brassica napus]
MMSQTNHPSTLKNWIRNIKQPASDDVEKILLGNKPRSNASAFILIYNFMIHD